MEARSAINEDNVSFEKMINKAKALYAIKSIELLTLLEAMIKNYSYSFYRDKYLTENQRYQFGGLISSAKQLFLDNPYAHVIHAMYLVRRGDVQEALIEYYQIHMRFPFDWYAFNRHAILCQSLGEYDKSALLFSLAEQAKKIRPIQYIKSAHPEKTQLQEDNEFEDLVKYMQAPVENKPVKKVTINYDDQLSMSSLPHVVTLFGVKPFLKVLTIEEKIEDTDAVPKPHQ